MAAISMQMMNKSQVSTYARYAFYIIAIINLIEQVIITQWLDMATKPLLMITLGIFYITSRENQSNPLSNLVIGALICSWIGDVLLMLQGKIEGIFIYGLIAFLMAHIFYVFAYQQARYSTPGKLNRSFVRTRIVFLIFIGGALIYLLYPGLGTMLIPVIIYTIVIIAMGISALLRRGWTTDKSFILVYSGALLFIMSDAMIGINHFMNPIIQARLLIMATYIAAQFMIVKGILLHENARGPITEINAS